MSFSGQSGTCRMYVWTYTTVSTVYPFLRVHHLIYNIQPNRDGSLENDIPVHEMTHGITNRMTGGGTGRCLQTTEAGGMGEGWGGKFFPSWSMLFYSIFRFLRLLGYQYS